MTISGNRVLQSARIIRSAAILLCALGIACASASDCAAMGKMWLEPGEKAEIEKVSASDLPAFADDQNFEDLAAAVGGSIDYYRKLPSSKMIAFGEKAYPASHLVRSLEHFLAFIEAKPTPAELSTFIERNYHVYAFTNRSGPVPVLFTGYYEPFLKGSRVRTETYRYPVYPRPDDLVTFNLSDFSAGCAEKTGVGRLMEGNLVSYYSRSQIEDTGVLEGHLSPIAWVDDRVALFFLQIQGSGKIRLTDGSTLNVHYLVSNGHPYKSIGGYLVENKKMKKKDVSMQSIKDYLLAHPEEIQEILQSNPRYVFFETRENGPVGCFDIELTPGRSVALDRQIAPAGALAFIVSEKPVADCSGKIESWEPFSRFVVNQDTGSAIQGPGRADIFWGNGVYAELAAGYMKQPGNLYFLVLKPEMAGP